MGEGEESEADHHLNHDASQLLVSEDISQGSIGLTGGIVGYFLGWRKKFKHSPLIVSGYLLTPFLLYHVIIMRWGLVNPESKGFTFVDWLLTNSDWWIRVVGGIIPLSVLIVSGTYHIGAGICKYLKIKDVNKRKKWAGGITLLSITGLISIFRLSMIEHSGIPLKLEEHFTKIFKILNLK